MKHSALATIALATFLGACSGIKTTHDFGIFRLHAHAVALAPGLLGETAGNAQRRILAGVAEDIKIHFRHRFQGPRVVCRAGGQRGLRGRGTPVARSMRYCTSSGTGLPVAPFFLPLRQAVPAISRCAQQ